MAQANMTFAFEFSDALHLTFLGTRSTRSSCAYHPSRWLFFLARQGLLRAFLR
jgi:hypothetical protein